VVPGVITFNTRKTIEQQQQAWWWSTGCRPATRSMRAFTAARARKTRNWHSKPTAWLLGKTYAGSMIVNAANARFFEPAPGRRLLVGVRSQL